jgi:hypothetical protein
MTPRPTSPKELVELHLPESRRLRDVKDGHAAERDREGLVRSGLVPHLSELPEQAVVVATGDAA